MTKSTIAPFAGILLFLAAVIPSFGIDPATVLANSRVFGSSPRLALEMSMSIEERGAVKERTVKVWLQQSEDASSLMAAVTKPSILSNLKFLRLVDQKNGLRQWVKTSRGVMRVSGTGGGDRIFGSHFTVEDFGEQRSWGSAAEVSLAPVAPESGLIALRIVNADPSSSWRIKTMWIDGETGLVMRALYADENGTSIRRYKVLEVHRADGLTYPAKATMEQLEDGGRTVLEIHSVSSPTSLSQRLFNPAGL